MAAIEVYQDIPQTQVSAGGTDAPSAGTSQSWTVASGASFPTADSDGTPPTQFHISDPALASEIILVTDSTGGGGLTWTVTRGAEGTTPVAHTAGFTVKQVVTAGGLSVAGTGQNLWCSPNLAGAETFPRLLSSGNQALTASGTLYVTGISLPQYFTVSNIAMATKTPAASTLSHGWYALMDNSLVVRAVTADQTSTTWTATNTVYPVAVSAPYTTTYTGLYYVGVNVSAGTQPSLITCTGMSSALAAASPIVAGSITTGYSATPPAVTTALSGLAAGNNFTLYAYLS